MGRRGCWGLLLQFGACPRCGTVGVSKGVFVFAGSVSGCAPVLGLCPTSLLQLVLVSQTAVLMGRGQPTWGRDTDPSICRHTDIQTRYRHTDMQVHRQRQANMQTYIHRHMCTLTYKIHKHTQEHIDKNPDGNICSSSHTVHIDNTHITYRSTCTDKHTQILKCLVG